MRDSLLGLCIVHCALCIAACRVPNLETPQCTDARLAVKQFYSFHFGNDMTPSAENRRSDEKYLTSDLYRSLSDEAIGKTDYFTKSDEYPKTFKIGKCDSTDPSRANLQVQLYWQEERGALKDTTQKEVGVDAIKTNDGRWLIANVADARTK